MAAKIRFRERINPDYLRIFKEIPVSFFVSLLKKAGAPSVNTGRVLVIDTGLIGDFIVSLPALKKVIERHSAHAMMVFSSAEERRILNLPFVRKKGFKVVAHTGSGWRVKHWAVEKWVELLRRIRAGIDAEFIFIGGDTEKRDLSSISRKLGFGVFSGIGSLSLVDCLLLLRGL